MPRLGTLPLLSLLLGAAPLAGCATSGILPSAQFQGLRIETIQADPGKEDLDIALTLDFEVQNPLGVAIELPKHRFALEVDGKEGIGAGTQDGFMVPARTSRLVRYPFRLDLGSRGLGAALGKEAEFAFVATADLELPRRAREAVEKALGEGAGKAAGEAAGALGDAAGELAENALRVAAEAGGKRKLELTLAHRGKVRLPKMPEIVAKSGARPELEPVRGSGSGLRLPRELDEFREKAQPVAVLEAALGRNLDRNVQIPVGEMLQAMGVPSSLTSGAVDAINVFLRARGKPVIGAGGSVPLPVELPPAATLLKSVSPGADDRIEGFLAAWRAFSEAIESGELALPGEIPAGMRVSTPFQIRNPNQFAVTAPAFRFALLGPDGKPLLLLGALPAGVPVESGGRGDARDRTVEVAAGARTDMQLVGEIRWDLLGAGIGGAAAGGAGGGGGAPPLTLAGEWTLDLGYGPVTVPLELRLSAPEGQASTKEESKSSKSKEKEDGVTQTKKEEAKDVAKDAKKEKKPEPGSESEPKPKPKPKK
jgi:hypothetical protein